MQQVVTTAGQDGLGAGVGLRQGREQESPPRRGVAGALQYLGGETEERLEDYSRGRPSPAADDGRAQVEPQTAGGNHDPHRPGEERGGLARLLQERVEPLQQRPLRRPRPLGDDDAAGRAGRSRGDVEEAELLRHGEKDIAGRLYYFLSL